jgi:hypothetical protein
MVMRPPSRRRGAIWWLVVSGVVIAVGVVGLVLSRHYARDVHLHQALADRGVRVSASVESSHYDPSGGDPGGWTSDVVSFKDSSGRSFVATVGHHGSNTEAGSGKFQVIYDPSNPKRVQALTDFEQSSTSQGMLTLATAGSIALLAIGCGGLVAWLWRSRRSAGDVNS